MAVVVTPANKITLMVGTDQVECQVTSHTLTRSDPTQGDTLRTACGDVVNVPADATEVGQLQLTLLPPRGNTEFEQWTWVHHGETAEFDLVVNPGEPSALQWTGELTVAAIPEQQAEYTKIETVDVTWSVTEFTTVAVTPVAA